MRAWHRTVASIVLGLVLGSGTAMADAPVFWDMVDSYHTYGPETRELIDDPGYPAFPDHGYEEDHVGWADDDYPNATHFKLYDTGYYDGWSDSPAYVRFGTAWVKDQQSNHARVDFAWVCSYVDGIDEVRSIDTNEYPYTYWEYDGFTSQNSQAQYIQYVGKHDDPTCLYPSNWREHWSIWETQ